MDTEIILAIINWFKSSTFVETQSKHGNIFNVLKVIIFL